MRMQLTMETSGLDAYLLKLENKVTHVSPLMKLLGDIMRFAVDENFKQEGRPQKWQSLNIMTALDRFAQGYAGPILQREGTLRKSVKRRYLPLGVEIYSDSEYVAIHDQGGYAGRNRSTYIPERPIFVLTEEDINEIEKTVTKYISD